MGTKIDWSNPITNNLKRFCVFYSGNVCWDAVTRTFGVPQSNYGSHVITPYGVALNALDATGTQVPEWAGETALIGGSSGVATLGHTGMFLARSNKAGSRATQEFLGGAEGGGALGDIWNSRVLTSGQPNYTVYESDSPIGSNGTYPTGKDSQDWLFYGGTYNVADNEIICRVSSNPYDMAVDSTPASVSVAADPGNSSTMFSVGSLGSSVNSWDGDIVFAAEWLRPLSEGEWNSMVANPWQVFKPPMNFALADVPENVKWAATKLPSKNKIDWTNPITKGLIWYADFSTGQPYEWIRGEAGYIETNSKIEPGPEMSRPCYWGVPQQTDSLAIFPKGDDRLNGLSEITLMSLAKNSSTSNAGGTNQTLMGHGGTGADPYKSDWQATHDVRIWVYATAQYESVITDGLDVSAGENPQEWNLIGGTWGNDLLTARVNRRKDLTPTATTGTMQVDSAANQRPFVGGYSEVNDQGWGGWIAFSAIWNRELSDTEWNSMVDNPWQIFKSREVMVPMNEDLPVLGRFEVPE